MAVRYKRAEARTAAAEQPKPQGNGNWSAMREPKRYQMLQARLRTDMMTIDQELADMAVLVQDAGEQAAYCYAARDICKSELDVAIAHAAARLRSIPVSKTTRAGTTDAQRSEKQIETEVMLDPKVMEASRALEDAKLDLSLWQAMVDSLKTKSSSVNRIAELAVAGYITKNSALEVRRGEIRGRDARRSD